MPYILALDQGTSSSRSIVFDHTGHIVSMAQQELPQMYPQPGWVEHDPELIWGTQLQTAREALKQAKLQARDLHAIGITNQRETTLVWNRATGRPIHHAIVWQDRRGEAQCAHLRQSARAQAISSKTGLPIDPYFSATKLQWLLDHVPNARAQAQAGELAFGTVDTWLLWKLSGGTIHATDVSNASRTMLFNIHTQQWDSELLEWLNIPASLLPTVQASSSVFGHTQEDCLGGVIPIAGVAGDQQSALFGQACFKSGMAKNTYGTGCFMLMHTGGECTSSQHGLLSTCAAQHTAEHAYALEGSVFSGGSVVQWLRDGLGAIKNSSEVQTLAATVPDSAGVVLVPAFTGLGAPYWQPNARGTLTGITRGTTLGHIARAALESIAFQSAALFNAMRQDALERTGHSVEALRVDGGACVNDMLMQLQADLLGIPVVRPAVTETTALGAAYLAGLATGLYANTEEISHLWRTERTFWPNATVEQTQERMAQWERAVRQTLVS